MFIYAPPSPLSTMIYTSDYFNNCNGLIPQIVLSSLLLQAGNERAAIYKNQLTTDNSQTTTFSFDGTFLNIRGTLPLAESRYLISQPSLISRVGAINSENAAMFGDVLGLPVNGFLPRPTQESVTLPTGIANLSIAPLVIEKRLAYLVLLQRKRNRLIDLYNFLHYTNLASVLIRSRNVTSPRIGIITPAYQYTEGNTAVYVGAVTGVIGYDYSYVSDPVGRSASIVNICLAALVKTYPDLLRFNTTDQSLSGWSLWVVTELSKNDPVLIPPVDFDLLVELVSDSITTIRTQPLPREPLGYEPNESGSDVSATISDGGNDGGGAIVNTPTGFGSGSNPDSTVTASDSALLPATPIQSYEPLTDQRPTDTLPPC